MECSLNAKCRESLAQLFCIFTKETNRRSLIIKRQITFNGLHDITSSEDRTLHNSDAKISDPTKSTNDSQLCQKSNKSFI
jgi:hypothetical protein